MNQSTQDKSIRFFKYLLELNNLVGKVDRDYTVYENTWDERSLAPLEDVSVFRENDNEETFLEVRKPSITEKDTAPPAPPEELEKWLKGSFHNELQSPEVYAERNIRDEAGNIITIAFHDNEERVENFHAWKKAWRYWSDELKMKKKTMDLYNYFFQLVSRFEQEGDRLEFIFGRGILVWRHPDPKIGIIRHPLITSKLELELFPREGIITAKKIDENIKVERDMLSGVDLPNKARIDELINEMNQLAIDDEFDDVYEKFISLIHPDGKLIQGQETLSASKTPVIYDQNLFALRSKKVRILRQDLEQIVKGLENEELELTEAVTSIFEINESQESVNQKNNEVSPLPKNHLYFPLAANEQQKEIVERIDKNYGVTVQGPPGTGKTHTIANLVSHFLAQGKKILITSQKENALKVLKDKIPEAIRDLCVPVLGGGRESMDEIEGSIRVLSEKLGELDSERLQKMIDRNLDALDKSKREEAKLLNELKVYTKKEGSPLIHNGEKLYKYEVAKELVTTDVDYTWIKDDVPMDTPFPLEKAEWIELLHLRSRLIKEDLVLESRRLPQLEKEILNLQDFEQLMEEGDDLSGYERVGETIFEKYHLKKNKETIAAIRQSIQDILSYEDMINRESSNRIMEDLKAGDIRKVRWENLYHEQNEAVQKLFVRHHELITHDVNLPDKNLLAQKKAINLAMEHLKSGKKPNWMFFLLKGKQAKYLFEDAVLNGKAAGNLDDLQVLQNFVEFQDEKKEITRIINGNMAEINGKLIDSESPRFPYEAEEILKDVNTVITYEKDIQKLYEKFPGEKGNESNFYDFDELKRIDQDLMNAESYISLNQWKVKKDEEIEKIKGLTENSNVHPIIHQFLVAMKNKDKHAWKSLIGKLIELRGRQELVDAFYQKLDRFVEDFYATKEYITSTVGDAWEHGEDFSKPLELRKLQTWLDETADVSVSRLKDQLETAHKEQKRLIYEVVAASTWKSQIERITQEENRALSSWKSYIKRYGRGTGKSATTNLKGARDSMKTAQGAIPVWIMPMNQVIENFPVTNEKFDVIIFDESSQCDLFSINVLLRGKKMIVVGDEEQISPQAIGTKLDDVNELVRRYLDDIPNANLYDGNISLYEIAEQTFPKEGKLMLREHFRCVPEIIQFSNDLSYGGEMIPLRLPLEEEKLDPPIFSVKVNEGYNDERDKDINVPEAEKIVEDIVALTKDPQYNDQTIGVISLQGNKQAPFIETKLREAIGDEEFYNRKVICGDAYTLQGDERDIILLSMVIAPNRNFRALTRNSEKQRINVAASRAKNQMRLYHSVNISDVKPNDFRYRLLSYCNNPTRINEEIEDLESRCDSPFEVDVLRRIIAKGYKVTPQLKVGRYRIDLVIEGLRDRLAVECDGEAWHGPEKFEEDMQRQESLERAGWKFWRIRGREFYFNKDEAMESLWATLDEMGIEPNTTEVTSNQKIDIGQQNNYDEKEKDVNQFASENLNLEKQLSLLEDDTDQQMNLFEKERDNNSFENTNEWLINYFESKGLKVIDKRYKDGNLWVVGGNELKPILKDLANKDIYFRFAPFGSHSTNMQPGWYTKYGG
ncbi:AAA domain-containing protein [Virgibacillus oceani]